MVDSVGRRRRLRCCLQNINVVYVSEYTHTHTHSHTDIHFRTTRVCMWVRARVRSRTFALCTELNSIIYVGIREPSDKWTQANGVRVTSMLG